MFGKLFGGKSNSHEFDYGEPEIGHKILSVFGGNNMVACVTGMQGLGQAKELNEFCSHMAAAALQGDPLGVAMSCFSKHGNPFNQHLPVPVQNMSEEAFAIFVELLSNNLENGFSESAKIFLKSNGASVREKARLENPYAQWLMGAWYAFDDFDIKGQNACMQERMDWYEKSAFGGYLPAIKAVAGLFDNGDNTKDLSLPTDLRKSAYWYRQGALEGDPMCAFNLGVMYFQGDSINKNTDVASLWLSIAYKNSEDQAFSNHILGFSKHCGIQLSNVPDLNQDPELNSTTAEFQDVYEINDFDDIPF